MLPGARSKAAVVVAALVAPLASGPAHAACRAPGDPDCVDKLVAITGTVDFFATGASFAVDNDADDRPDALLEESAVVVPGRRIPPRAQLLSAYLYFGGSLFIDGDGNDTPDTEIELRVPGATDFARVIGEQVYDSGPLPPPFEDARLYTVRADITSLMKRVGGPLAGTYTARGFAADIFQGASEHTVASASFSVVLIFDEPRLPPRTIVVFDGMQTVLGSTVSLQLSDFIVSQVPSGSLTFYALEGDCNPGPGDCAAGNNLSGAERVRVIGAVPERRLVLSDASNPPNDIFNRTINTVEPPLSDVPGTDIDGFDISPVLRPGDTSVTVEITTPNAGISTGELIGLAYVIVGIDVFAPELRVDSRIEIRDERGEDTDRLYPGDPLRVTVAASNTGNLPATGVTVVTDIPANVVLFQVAEKPDGSNVTIEPKGGAFQRGRVKVDGLAVRHGEVNDLVVLMVTDCPMPNGGKITVTATIGAPAEGGLAFARTASATIQARDRCGPQFFLYGGGGCAAARGGGSLAGGLVVLGGLVLLRRRRARLLALSLLSLTVGCGGARDAQDQPAPTPIGVPCPRHEDMIVVPSIGGRLPYCVDRYEAHVVNGVLGNPDQSAAGADGDGSTTAVPRSERFTKPIRGVSWFQARAACKNAGKRLCTADEWETACRGSSDATYPYGEEYERTTCNGFDAARDDTVETGAMIVGVLDPVTGENQARGCVSQHGAYDMSGNLWEWNANSYLENTRRGLAGGSFRANAVGLRCVTEDNHARPAEVNDSYGFRCCRDF